MKGSATSMASFRQKAFGEFKEMAALALYLYVCLGAVVLLKAAILQDVGVHFAIWGIAAVKALLLAKFMLLGSGLHVGRRFRDRPLIWPTLYHALMFLILLLVLTALEEIVVGSIRHRSLSDSLTHVVGHTVFEGLAVCLVFYLILVPYSAFVCLADVLGERETFRLFFVDGARAISVRSPRTTNCASPSALLLG
jgi:multidrug transporter EmrE-like cation transporter